MKGVYIFYNSKKEKAVILYKKIVKYLDKIEIMNYNIDEINKADFYIVIGGDGTLLRGSKLFIDNTKPVLAVNMGSLGFMTDVKEEEAFDMIDNLIAGDCNFEKRYFLEISINNELKYALNDAIVQKNGPISRLIKLKLFSNKDYVNTYRADGIIISTPTGSTAYSLSAGGPILKPDLRAMLITPIAPHTLSARPIVVTENDEIGFSIIEEEQSITLTVDGQESFEVTDHDEIKIKLSDKYIELVKPQNRDYYSVLREKLKWGDDLC